MAPTVTVVSGGVSPALLQEIENVFSVFQDKLFKARNAEKYLAQQIKLQQQVGKVNTREIIRETNKNIYFILKQAQMNEQKMWKIINNMRDRHEASKSQIYDNAMKKATAMASELAALSKHHEDMEVEYLSHLNSMHNKLKEKDAQFENLKQQMADKQREQMAKAMENRHDLMGEQDTKHLQNMQYIQDMIDRSGNRWRQLFKEVNSEFARRLKELNGKASASFKGKMGVHYEETMRNLKDLHESQYKEWKDMMRQVSDMHLEWMKDVQSSTGNDPVLASNQEQHVQMVDLMEKHDIIQMEQAKDDVKEVLEDLDEEYLQLKEMIKQNHTLEKALEHHINNESDSFLEWALKNKDDGTAAAIEDDKDSFEEDLPVLENENNDWIDSGFLNSDINQEVLDQSVTTSEPNNNNNNNSNNGLALPIWAISLISVAGVVVLGLVVFGMYKCYKSKNNNNSNNGFRKEPSCAKISHSDTMELTDEKNGQQFPKLNNDLGNITVTLDNNNSGGYYDHESQLDPRAASL